MSKLAIIGIGEDGLEGLSAHARGLLENAELVFGGARHLGMLTPDDGRETVSWSKDLGADIDRIIETMARKRIAVLASGDPMQHGIGVRLVERLGVERVEIVPFASAFSLAASRMGWALSDPMVETLSVHARPFDTLVRYLSPGMRLLVLSRDSNSPAEIANCLVANGYPRSPITILERMGGQDERRTYIETASDGVPHSFENLNTVAIECVVDPATVVHARTPGLPDDAYDHDNTITKREVRAVTLAALAPRPGEVLWDVGAGNGTIAIEWLRAEPRAYAIAFERDGVRAKRIEENARALGVPELNVIQAPFPIPFDGMEPAPSAVFVGGGIASDENLIDTCLDCLAPGGRLVANAVTLEAQARLFDAHEKRGGDLIKVAVSHVDAVGTFRALKPAIDVLQLRITKE